MKLYKNLPGYDLESRINKALDRGADWFTESVENTLAVGVGLVFIALAIIAGAHGIRSMV